jgi:PAS domain-containing protein
MSTQKPLELILARNLLTSISTPAFLVGAGGRLVFFNEAAGAMLGRHFEETGTMEAQQWTRQFGPLGADDEPIPLEEIPLTIALRQGEPSHGTFRIRNAGGSCHDVAASAVPIVGPDGSSGGMVFFWPLRPEAEPEGR